MAQGAALRCSEPSVLTMCYTFIKKALSLIL